MRLRAGGCAHACLSGSSVEQLSCRGNAGTRLRHYVQGSASVLALRRLPLAATQKLGALAVLLAGVIVVLTLAWAVMGGLAVNFTIDALCGSAPLSCMCHVVHMTIITYQCGRGAA